MIEYMYIYSPSGQPLKNSQENMFAFDGKVMAKQTNTLLLAGKVGVASDDNIETHFTLGFYNSTGQAISEPKEYSLKICKTNYCS